eukprot:301886-Pelagomonas_calceolata.AAC.3
MPVPDPQVCDLLKAFLDDDTDMWDMHLTAKETQRTAAQEAAARMMEEVTAMAEQAAHMPRLEKVGPCRGARSLPR